MFSFLRKNSFRKPVSARTNSYGAQILANFIISASIIVAVIFSASFIEKQISSQSQETKKKILLSRAVEERYEIYNNLSKDFKRFEPLFPILYSAIPNEEKVIAFYDMVEALAKETGNQVVFQFSSQEPSQDAQLPKIWRAQFSATLEGNRETFERFFKGFDQLPFIAVIEKVSLDGREGIEGAAKMSIQGAVFLKKEQSL